MHCRYRLGKTDLSVYEGGTATPKIMTPAQSAVEIRQLRYFLAVSDELHFRRAAERLHIAQPPLSQAIQKLEAALGVQLLERTSRTVAPTEAGRVFAVEAQKVLESLERAVSKARWAANGWVQPRIGCVTHLPTDELHRFLCALRRREPSIRSQVTHMVTIEQLARLRAGELELGILYFVEGFGFEGVETEALFEGIEMVALLPERHPAAAKELVGPADLVGESLVLFPRWVNAPLHDWIVERIAGAGYRFGDVHEVAGPDPRDMVLGVAEEAGVALVPLVYEDGWARGIVARRPLEVAVSMPPTVLGWRADAPAGLRPFIEHARTVARELRGADRNRRHIAPLEVRI
jgi:DNA-binding transcriptional LysR family regulator